MLILPEGSDQRGCQLGFDLAPGFLRRSFCWGMVGARGKIERNMEKRDKRDAEKAVGVPSFFPLYLLLCIFNNKNSKLAISNFTDCVNGSTPWS